MDRSSVHFGLQSYGLNLETLIEINPCILVKFNTSMPTAYKLCLVIPMSHRFPDVVLTCAYHINANQMSFIFIQPYPNFSCPLPHHTLCHCSVPPTEQTEPTVQCSVNLMVHTQYVVITGMFTSSGELSAADSPESFKVVVQCTDGRKAWLGYGWVHYFPLFVEWWCCCSSLFLSPSLLMIYLGHGSSLINLQDHYPYPHISVLDPWPLWNLNDFREDVHDFYEPLHFQQYYRCKTDRTFLGLSFLLLLQ